MRRKITHIFAIAALSVFLFGCTAAALRSAHAEIRQMLCIASYSVLSPYELVGWDDCGNIWKVIFPRGAYPQGPKNVEDTMGRTSGDTPECWHFDMQAGKYMEFPCPAAGDTLGTMEVDGDAYLR
jgi:hypothetical protein